MNIYPTIEAMLHYAGAHLLLDELDYVYARNSIMELLGLNAYEEYEINDAEIEEMTVPDELVDTLLTYATSQNPLDEDKRRELSLKLVAAVLKRPGEIADLFSSLPRPKGFEWLSDYGYKSGYIRTATKKWEAKNTKGRLEVAYTGAQPKGDNKKYPACRFCRENEGYGANLLMRAVPLDLGDERMFFYYKKNPVVQGHANIVAEYHRPLEIGRAALHKMFDFVAAMPSWFIAAKNGKHEKYVVGSRFTPLHKAKDKNKFKSAEYPYVNVTVVDWYIGTVRLLCTNREKLIEYSEKLINMWNSSERETAVCVRKIDSEYCVELMFLGRGKSPAAEYSNLATFGGVLQYMGVFGLDKEKETQLKAIEKFVAKEEKFSPAKLEGGMSIHADMIGRLLASAGKEKPTQLEAELDVKDEVNKTLENALISLSEPIEELYTKF
ncbi:MAG: hypothetical protein FWE84_03190 [Firmicutes bacterium]|nr:hypothetical protein [Bacillota bacterium]